MGTCGTCEKACGETWCSDYKKPPRDHVITEQKLETMLKQIEEDDHIAIFNAKKSCFIYVDSKSFENVIKKYLEAKLEALNERSTDTE